MYDCMLYFYCSRGSPRSVSNPVCDECTPCTKDANRSAHMSSSFNVSPSFAVASSSSSGNSDTITTTASDAVANTDRTHDGSLVHARHTLTAVSTLYATNDAEDPPVDATFTAGERKVHAFLRKLEATKALNATQEAQLAALEAKLAPPPPPPHPPSSWTANARVRAPPAAEPELRDPPPARSVRDAHAPPPRPPSAPPPRRAAWQNAAPPSPSPERTPPATPERAGGESWPGVRDVTPPKSSPKPSPKKRVSFSPHVLLRVRTGSSRLDVASMACRGARPSRDASRESVAATACQRKSPLSKGRARRVPAAQVEEWPGVTEAAPRAMPARDDGMKVVKSRRGHGAVSPETARANARKRREAQRLTQPEIWGCQPSKVRERPFTLHASTCVDPSAVTHACLTSRCCRRPSSARRGARTAPNASWDLIAALRWVVF